MIIGGGAPGALRRASSLCSQASHKGLWIYPVKGLGALARLRRGLAGLNGLWDAGLREEGPQTCMRRQINTRATMRSCSNNTFGVMMASPFTTVKGDEFTRLTPAGIIRCLQVQDQNRAHSAAEAGLCGHYP